MMSVILRAVLSLATLAKVSATTFLEQIDSSHWVIGNDLWNITQGPIYGTKLYYNDADLIGNAFGHYVGYDGESNLVWTSATISAQRDNYIDVRFTSIVGDLHWVIFDDVAGAYQYFVNRALPDISILRTLLRLDPIKFPNGRTYLKDEPLPDFSLYANATKIQDETWQLADGTFITKYDWSNYVRQRDFNGIYGDEFGSWYIHPSTEYFSGNHLKQTLTVHRESSTGDSVQLNVVQDTSHYQVGATTAQPVGKVWGPWLWYLNNGSRIDATRKQHEEVAKWPYPWFTDTEYQSRGSISGSFILSDGRPASGAAVFLGDTNITSAPLSQGSNYYYTTYADKYGKFSFSNVRAGTYGLYAWSNGGVIGDVYTNFSTSDVIVSAEKENELKGLNWNVPAGHEKIFQVGDFDKTTLGFRNGGAPYQHGLAQESPANLTYVVGNSKASDWYFAQSQLGSWDIVFPIESIAAYGNRTALLTISLAGYSQSTALTIRVNSNTTIGSLSKDYIVSDPAVYRSGTSSGEWHLFQYRFNGGSVLKPGTNTISFTVDRYTLWRGFLYDGIALEWV